MSVKANQKTQKTKRDPYQVLLRTTLILAIVVVVGFGIFFLCRMLIENEYIGKREALMQQNTEAEQAFNAEMNALRATHAPASVTTEQQNFPVGELPYWEEHLGGKIWRIEDEGRAPLENTHTVSVDRASLINGGLLLINEWHSQPSDFSSDQLLSIGTTSGFKIKVQDNFVQLFPPAYDALLAMVEDAGTEGLTDFIAREGFRSNEAQTALFDAQRERLSGQYTGEALIAQTKRRVNYPGTSDYQSGLSFRMDIYPAKDGIKFQQSDHGHWFTENAWKYGVIFRFPTADFPSPHWEDKSYKTGVTLQLNLYRYVGKAHSTAMRVLGFCLEEYIEFLQDHPHLCIYEDGALRYEIYRVDAPQEAQTSYDLLVPNPAKDYQASLDNMGGIVLAFDYGS